MRIWTITLLHTSPNVFTHGLKCFYDTATPVHHQHVLVDHHWPHEPWHTRHKALEAAEAHGCKLITPYANMGGHGGFTWAIGQLPIADEDLILGYDPDSVPVHKGWDKAMAEVLTADPTLGYVSLMHEAILPRHEWKLEDVGGHRLATISRVDMFNVTMWRASLLKSSGLQAHTKYYGFVEPAMRAELDKRGMRTGYMYDYHETFCPEQPPSSYHEWKRAHAGGGFSGNYDEYLEKTAI